MEIKETCKCCKKEITTYWGKEETKDFLLASLEAIKDILTKEEFKTYSLTVEKK